MRNTYNMEDELYEVVLDLKKAYEAAAPEIVEHQEFLTEDAEILVIAHGIVSRAVQGAVKILREQGVKAGHFRPITLRPFPGEELKRVASKAKKILIAESAVGQLSRMVKEQLYGLSVPVEDYFRPGQGITVEEVVEKVKTLAK